MIEQLIKLADSFDKKGLCQEADVIDSLIKEALNIEQTIEGVWSYFQRNKDELTEEHIMNHLNAKGFNVNTEFTKKVLNAIRTSNKMSKEINEDFRRAYLSKIHI